MNWNDIDSSLLQHFRTLGKIRNANPVIGTGRQRTLDVHTCLRYNNNDSILIRVHPENGKAIEVNGIFLTAPQLLNYIQVKRLK